MCNVLISLIMDDLTNPIIAFFVTTFVTVIIGEILPEAICFRLLKLINNLYQFMKYIIYF